MDLISLLNREVDLGGCLLDRECWFGNEDGVHVVTMISISSSSSCMYYARLCSTMIGYLSLIYGNDGGRGPGKP